MVSDQQPPASEQSAPAASTPPGWYPDHTDPSLQRWWDGNAWSEHTQQSYAAGDQQASAPEGTSWNTPWIWLLLALPLVSVIAVFFVDFSGYTRDLLADPTNPYRAISQLFSPAMLVLMGLSWVILILTVVFSWLDWRELKRRGIPRPFHWAFSFLVLVTGIGVVYPIGRAVVTQRRGAGGRIVFWLAIVVAIVCVILLIVWIALFMTQLMGAIMNSGVVY